MNRGDWQLQSMGSQKVRHGLATKQQQIIILYILYVTIIITIEYYCSLPHEVVIRIK